ncbi:hypothetical protein [Gimesia chilikensis]|jgi:hypothetical protein|uniref:DUF3618 domain-containing protein n=1 Tax=Gimesia chilikensis TaxID=2605989 RepID=A0A517PK69_9PLAN|nr:hypothetical protein [Gimesia chilikensis]QDT19775.1 hypothetical protein HG66A1_15430 [Gimesia chilikensis]
MNHGGPGRSAEEISHSMKRLRNELDGDVHQIKQSAATLSDWQYYIRNYPWISLGGAALIGYLLVPKRLEIQSPDAETIEKLARKNRLVVENQPRKHASRGGLQTVASFVTRLLVKAATAQLMHHFANGIASQEPASSFAGSETSSNGAGEHFSRIMGDGD